MPAGAAGRLGEALGRIDEAKLAEARRKYLDASRCDGRGGAHSTGARYWFVFNVYGLGTSPIPDPVRLRGGDYEYAALIEDRLERCALWILEERPFGSFVSAKSVGKYVSQMRTWYRLAYKAVLGLGAEGSRIPDLLRGAARLVPQPPPKERLGVTPADLAAGFAAELSDGSGESRMWRAAMSFGMGALARGIEFALDDGPRA